MAAAKRKENTDSKIHTGSTPKKARKEADLANGSKLVQDLETATDSDPLVESDTTTQSGDDDGISWPSDDEVEASEHWKGVGVAGDNAEEGVKIAEAADASKSVKKVPNINSTASGMSQKIVVG